MARVYVDKKEIAQTSLYLLNAINNRIAKRNIDLLNTSYLQFSICIITHDNYPYISETIKALTRHYKSLNWKFRMVNYKDERDTSNIITYTFQFIKLQEDTTSDLPF